MHMTILMRNSESKIKSARILFENGRNPEALFLYIVAYEQLQKINRLILRAPVSKNIRHSEHLELFTELFKVTNYRQNPKYHKLFDGMKMEWVRNACLYEDIETDGRAKEVMKLMSRKENIVHMEKLVKNMYSGYLKMIVKIIENPVIQMKLDERAIGVFKGGLSKVLDMKRTHINLGELICKS